MNTQDAQQSIIAKRAAGAIGIALAAVILLASLSGVRAASTLATWTSVGPYGGRIYKLAIDKFSPTTLYASTDNGLFKTVDSGSSWQQVEIGFPGKQISAIDIDYDVIPRKVYVAGSCNLIGRSSDNGKTWETISTGIPVTTCINSLAVDSTQGDRIWVGTGSGVYGWNKTTLQWEPTAMVSSTYIVAARNENVYAVTEQDIFSSTNNGLSWTSILGDFPTGYQQRRITSLQIDPNNSQTLYVGTWYGGAYKTTNGGQHWANINTGLPAFTQIDDFAIDPANASTIYAASYGWFNGDANASGIFKSIDGGGSWDAVSAGLINRYIHTIVVHPTLGNTVYAGADSNGVFRSTSGGSAWQGASQGLKNVDITAILRLTNTIYVATTLNGVYKTINEGTSWERINNGLPPTTQFGHALAADEQGNVYFSVYKWGLLRLNSNTWVTVTNSLTQTEIRAIAAVSGTLMIGTASPDKPDEMGILISTDMGNTWTPQNTGLPTTTFQIHALSVQQIGYSVTVFAATSEGIYRTALSPISWIPSNSGLTTKNISAVTVDPNNPNVLYAATSCAYVFKSDDGGGTWGQRTNGLNTSCSLSTGVNPADSNQVYAGMDNGVYQSNDGGSFWSKLGADSLNDTTKDLEILPDQTLLAATTSGVWRTQISAPITPTATPTTTITPIPSVSQTWTVMVYLNGDNNLDRYMAEAFNRLESAASNPNIKILALWDGPSEHDTREYLVQPYGHSYVEGVNYWNWDELDMGNPNTLIDFVNRSRARQPADHYFLAIVDHGGGWSPELYPTCEPQVHVRIVSDHSLHKRIV